jgi:hypothetical protein
VVPPPIKVGTHFESASGGPQYEGTGVGGAYAPKDLQEAYDIPATGGSTQTIALIDAYGYEAAESDLAKYREHYGLPPCTHGDGCFRKVNEDGEEENYPTTESPDWYAETALDLDMASAACPECHIILVEATEASISELAHSVQTAASLGATEISNSYGWPEEDGTQCGTTDCEQYSEDYNIPGVLVTASAGDYGYDNELAGYASPEFPASDPSVVAVGGTSLHRATNERKWLEQVWSDSGGGCSLVEPKPFWQTDMGCETRTDNDVAAVAATETPVSAYSTPEGGWFHVGGTSVASPLIAGIEAHASDETRSAGAEAFYRASSQLVDVTEGSNGTCTPPQEDEYLCQAEIGYDGPTGYGTPYGVPNIAPPVELPVASQGWEVSSFASGFPSTYLGPLGIVANAANDLYIADAPAGSLYEFGSEGGQVGGVGALLEAGPIGDWPIGLAFGKNGALYAVIDGENKVVELDPATGAVLRTIAEVSIPLGIATDPVSGDLFVTSDGEADVVRISNPESASPSVSPYATELAGLDGISAAPDGTFYTESDGAIDRIAATDSPEPGAVTSIGYVAGADGISVGANPLDPAAPAFVVVNSNDGFLAKVELNGSEDQEDIFSGGTRGDFVTVAPNGCLYATQTSIVVRVALAGGGCPFAPISPFQPPEPEPAVPGPVTSNSVEMTATVNPHGAATTFHFDYGTNVSYGQSTEEASAGSATTPVTVSQTVGNLAPDTTYHYRLVAHNQAGTVYGPDTFVTTAATSTPGPPIAAPADLTLPTISGHPQDGQLLECHPGAWGGATTLSITWVRDSATVASGASYRVSRADIGHRLACVVTALGPGGTTQVESQSVAVAGSPSAFAIRLTSRRATASALKTHGPTVSVTVPRPCSVTLRLLLIRATKHGVSTTTLSIRHVSFSRRGAKTLQFQPVSHLTTDEILRVAAVAKAGNARSAPASVTIHQ